MNETDETAPAPAPEQPSPAPAKSRPVGRTVRTVVGLAVLVGVILWSAGVFKTRTPGGQLDVQPGVPLPANATTYTVKELLVAPHVDVVGTVASETRVNISARIPACVREIYVAAGSTVTQGQLLVVLDDREIREQVSAAEAQYTQAETEYNRARQLFDKQAATEQALTAAQSGFAAARAQWERSRVMLTYTRIAAPMDGRVTDRRVEAGDLAGPGQTLLAIYDPARMQLEAPVPVRLVPRLPIGQAVEVTLDRSAARLQGHVRQIVSEVDPLSRTQLVKVGLAGTPEGILPGTFGRLWVDDEARPAIMIPATAVFMTGQVELVQVVHDGRALRRAVRTGGRHDGSVEVLAGLAAGDVVLATPVREN
ncbi:MAG: efflux RND transporter periplasmic adaptor subunit [Kiritimatiellae bacterium]|nr:efflux RND transporter periplasmic adaptor subunit [Kiritimatiellia bacterium]